MIAKLGYLVLILILGSPLLAQQNTAPDPGLSAEEILLNQIRNRQDPKTTPQNLNERMKTRVRMTKTVTDYVLGPGDVIEITVVGIPGLEKREFSLDGQGNIFVPYIGQVELMGVRTREAETRLAGMFGVSLLEDPQVTVNIKEYRSQYFYVMGAVKQTGRYPLRQSMDILDALAVAGGLNDKADTNIKIHRLLPASSEDFRSTDPPETGTNTTVLDFSLSELLETGQTASRVQVFSGDVIEVQEKRDVSYYVLGDIPKPGAFLVDSNKRMSLSRALANAGGMLKTAAGKRVMILRQKESQDLPEQIKVNAYRVLKGDEKDIELCENDIVLVPGSASKTLGKSFLSGVSGLLGTLLIIGAR